ncbi:hypothetical protein BA953_00800 [Vibrio coralliilyticus]|uniref:type VI secretion system baseplate subunit TssE n=1 Tax=Vibrio coralliilyticus TaxID=190893 RepID=UPI000810A602|nr:type VI secretion system baseplate subunit TssE [Vibrio coralliilyticus]ANW25625.1 hypothetical protein BA953_00800 [Vibrio coralliilyticus]
MKQQRLLERIGAKENRVSNVSDEELLIESITVHIHYILNSQQGSVQIDSQFGMPDFNELRWGDGVDNATDLEKFITKLILKYEPRIDSLNVRSKPKASSPLSLSFGIEAKIKIEEKTIPIVFETILKPDGYISIERKA